MSKELQIRKNIARRIFLRHHSNEAEFFNMAWDALLEAPSADALRPTSSVLTGLGISGGVSAKTKKLIATVSVLLELIMQDDGSDEKKRAAIDRVAKKSGLTVRLVSVLADECEEAIAKGSSTNLTIFFCNTPNQFRSKAKRCPTTRELQRDYLNKRDSFDIFIERHNVEVRGQDDHVKRITFRFPYAYRLLVMLLRYRGQEALPMELYYRAWTDAQAIKQPIPSYVTEDEAKRRLKSPIFRLKKRMNEILPSFDIPQKSGPGYRCGDGFTSCVILDSETVEHLTLPSCEPV